VDELIYGEEANDVLLVKYLDPPESPAGTQPLDPSTARWPESEHRIGLPVAAIGSHFTFQFDGAKAPPNLLLLHSPSLRLTIHIPSHSEGAERVSRPPLMCPVLACVTMP
jgi:hypothetical protein